MIPTAYAGELCLKVLANAIKSTQLRSPKEQINIQVIGNYLKKMYLSVKSIFSQQKD